MANCFPLKLKVVKSTEESYFFHLSMAMIHEIYRTMFHYVSQVTYDKGRAKSWNIFIRKRVYWLQVKSEPACGRGEEKWVEEWGSKWLGEPKVPRVHGVIDVRLFAEKIGRLGLESGRQNCNVGDMIIDNHYESMNLNYAVHYVYFLKKLKVTINHN